MRWHKVDPDPKAMAVCMIFAALWSFPFPFLGWNINFGDMAVHVFEMLLIAMPIWTIWLWRYERRQKNFNV